jgi:hypothetical protein
VDEGWLDTVRMARDCGDISSLFPPGITHLWQLPHTIHTAIRSALYFLTFDELPYPEDRPPKRIWLDSEKMADWWRAVKERRTGDQEVAEMPQNEALKEMFPGVKFG